MADPVTPAPPPASHFEFRREPAPEVLDYFRHKGLTPSFHWTDVSSQEHATTLTVAKATSLEVLQTIRAELDRAIAEGLPYEQFRAALEPRLKSLGWWGIQPVTDPVTGETVLAQLGSPRRLKLIYDANIRTANAAGQWARIWRTRDLLPFLIYQHTTSAEPREEHWHWADIPVTLRVDDPWWDTHFPPNGWNCKCWVLQADEEDARAAGWTPETTAPEVDLVEWTNTRTGMTDLIPEGIDPGWASNPGKTRQQIVDGYLDGQLAAADPMIRAVALADMGRSWLYRMVTEGHVGNDASPRGPVKRRLLGDRPSPDVRVPAGWLDKAVQDNQGWKSGVVWIDADAVAAMRRVPGHKAVDWQRLPEIIDRAAVVRDETTRDWLSLYHQVDGKWHRVEVMMRAERADGSLLDGGPRLRIERFRRVDAKSARIEIEAARGDGRLLRADAPGPGLAAEAAAIVDEAARHRFPDPLPAPPADPAPTPSDASETRPSDTSPAAEPPARPRQPRRRLPDPLPE